MLMHVRRTSALLFARVQRVSEPGVASWNRPAPGPLTTLPTKVQLLTSPLLPLRWWHKQSLDCLLTSPLHKEGLSHDVWRW